MNVSLTPKTEKFVQSQIDAGLYSSPEQLVEVAVARLMEEMEVQEVDLGELAAETAAAIKEAQAEFERGEGMDLATFKRVLFKRVGRTIP